MTKKSKISTGRRIPPKGIDGLMDSLDRIIPMKSIRRLVARRPLNVEKQQNSSETSSSLAGQTSHQSAIGCKDG
jgi:hypothetical protein